MRKRSTKLEQLKTNEIAVSPDPNHASYYPFRAKTFFEETPETGVNPPLCLTLPAQTVDATPSNALVR
jgi:hypothetical protein